MSVPNLKESVSSPVPQIYTRFYIFARVPRDESRRVSSNKLSFQLSFKAATGLKCADLRTRCPTARFKARAARPPPNCGGHARRDSREARAAQPQVADLDIAAQAIPTISMDTTMYSTRPPRTTIRSSRPISSIKTLIFAVAATLFVLGAVFATFVAPKSTIGTYNFAASEKCHVCCLYPLWCECC